LRYKEESLATLLELNDRVSSVLNKADSITLDFPATHDIALPFSAFYDSDKKDAQLPPQARTADVLFAADDVLSKDEELSIKNAVLILRRGNAKETLTAVDRLLELCNFGGEIRLHVIKRMMSAGALQSMISLLSRSVETEVELELPVSKAISVLVTYEDDWALLQRSAYEIITSLYTLQKKTQARSRRNTTVLAMDNPGQLMNMLSGGGAGATDDKVADINALVSAAIAKLSLVLSAHWAKAGTFTSAQASASMMQMNSNNPNPAGRGVLEFKRSNSGINWPIGTTSGNGSSMDASFSSGQRCRTHSNPMCLQGVESSSKILDVLLSLITTVAGNESSLASLSEYSPRGSRPGSVRLSPRGSHKTSPKLGQPLDMKVPVCRLYRIYV
jgi:hypothetical protein